MTTAQQIADLERRISVQEYLHRDADEDGNIRHSLSLIPYLAIASLLAAGYTYWFVANRPLTKNGKIFLGGCTFLALLVIGVTFYFKNKPAVVQKMDYKGLTVVKNEE